MSTQLSAIAQALLEGVSLPAKKEELLEYARRQDDSAEVAAALERIPDREYRSLDEVGEAIAPVQQSFAQEERLPRAESGPPPGGDAYVHR